jgi:hypothetical protein
MNQFMVDSAIYLWTYFPATVLTTFFYAKGKNKQAVLSLVLGIFISAFISPPISQWCNDYSSTTVGGEYFLVISGLLIYFFYFGNFLKKIKRSKIEV